MSKWNEIKKKGKLFKEKKSNPKVKKRLLKTNPEAQEEGKKIDEVKWETLKKVEVNYEDDVKSRFLLSSQYYI